MIIFQEPHREIHEQRLFVGIVIVTIVKVEIVQARLVIGSDVHDKARVVRSFALRRRLTCHRQSQTGAGVPLRPEF